MAAVVRTESGFNPYAIGVVRGKLLRQPGNIGEAIATVHALDADGWNYSAGLAQVNRLNWLRLGLNPENAFDPCSNLRAGAAILRACLRLARASHAEEQEALRKGLSCYASGNFIDGYRTGYVQRVLNNAMENAAPQRHRELPPIVTSVLPIPVMPVNTPGPVKQPQVPMEDQGKNMSDQTFPRSGGQEEKMDSSAVVF